MNSSPSLTADCRAVKQKITKRLSSSLRSLQMRYVTTDDVITSDDDDANALCVALEAVFVHGLNAKFIKMQSDRRRKKGRHVSLPQPAFWTLLKAITHRNVIGQLEGLSYITTDVGRCRSWLRLALNDSLMECYFLTLRREKLRLVEYYQPFALMLDEEDCDVVLSYLQGLSSLPFDLSYKSSILNEWTASPLSLSGLWPDEAEQRAERRKSLDSVSQSSGSDDTNHSMIGRSERKGDTGSSSSQLSSSLGSDEHSRGSSAPALSESSALSSPGTDPEELSKSPEEYMDVASDMTSPRSPSHLLLLEATTLETSCPESSKLVEEGHLAAFGITMQQTQSRSMPHRSVAFELPVQEIQSWTQSRTTPDTSVACDLTINLLTTQSLTIVDASVACDVTTNLQTTRDASAACDVTTNMLTTRDTSAAYDLTTQSLTTQDASAAFFRSQSDPDLQTESSNADTPFPKSRSWITEDDFTSVYPIVPEKEAPAEVILPRESSEQTEDQSETEKRFHVIHRRRTGQSNPFRGLLMMGSLERKNVLGLYKQYYCELTPYEFRLQLEGDEQACAENCSLLRCEMVGDVHSDGRFELQFPGKRLCMRASSRDEGQDWVDRISEAVQKLRPQKDDAWEILDVPNSAQNSLEQKLGSPARDGSSSPSESFDWASSEEVETDALKESVLYMRVDRKWTRFIFSLSQRALKCFLFRNLEKSLCEVYSIEMVRDILPDSSLGSPSCFRLVTTKGSLQLQAESAEEAKAWRELVRAVFLEAEEDLTYLPTLGNYQVKSHIKEHPLFRFLMNIPTERGLDLQNFKCAGCHKRIGFQFGKAKYCSFSALYYCDLCHQDERSAIPSRIVHNWDATERPVSRQALNFLKTVQNEPLFHLKYLNEGLYEHTEMMAAMCCNREKLRLLAEYLMACRSGALQELTACLEQRTYLLECAHTYSVRDLFQIGDGVFVSFLQSAVALAGSHVLQCDVCSQRGFICQICNADDIIYPFQLETTTRCGVCKAVFHTPCKDKQSQCPRCVRRRKYQNPDEKV
ncbi:pleckstrin homology domain-containing family M member 1 [Hyperolius riggenbachi]|uniref:pleckstrin homology domain-containing family M member 1 n=1 Tax=Hyperolius riggenbachi TaxID=752182 RepID=UPI0035A2A54A